jgi:hypothetical protein
MECFHGFIQQARAQVAAGEEAPGALGLLVAAADEEGNRWVVGSLAVKSAFWY